MKILILQEFVGKPVSITLQTNFKLRGVITEVIDDCVRFETNQKESIMDCENIIQIEPRPRLAWEEECPSCGGIWYRKTSFDNCPYCKKGGCKGCK